jgi:hypothetical protein
VEAARRRRSRRCRRSSGRRRWARGPTAPANQGRGPNNGSELGGAAHRDGAAAASVPVALVGSDRLAQTSGEGAEEGALGMLLVRKKGAWEENFGSVVTGAF